MADANSINFFILMGPVGQDAELFKAKKTSTHFAVLNLATHEIWLRKNKEPEKRTIWHRVTVWGDSLAKFTAKKVKKGMMITVEGKIFTRIYRDKEGNERKAVDLKADKLIIIYPPKRKQEEIPATEKPAPAKSKDPY